jgi:hypothetical protein
MLGFVRLRGGRHRKAGKEPTAMHARRTRRRGSSSWIDVRKMIWSNGGKGETRVSGNCSYMS